MWRCTAAISAATTRTATTGPTPASATPAMRHGQMTMTNRVIHSLWINHMLCPSRSATARGSGRKSDVCVTSAAGCSSEPYKHETPDRITAEGLVTTSCRGNCVPLTITMRSPLHNREDVAGQSGDSAHAMRPAATRARRPIHAGAAIDRRTARRRYHLPRRAPRETNYRPVGERVIPVARDCSDLPKAHTKDATFPPSRDGGEPRSQRSALRNTRRAR